MTLSVFSRISLSNRLRADIFVDIFLSSFLSLTLSIYSYAMDEDLAEETSILYNYYYKNAGMRWDPISFFIVTFHLFFCVFSLYSTCQHTSIRR